MTKPTPTHRVHPIDPEAPDTKAQEGLPDVEVHGERFAVLRMPEGVAPHSAEGAAFYALAADMDLVLKMPVVVLPHGCSFEVYRIGDE